MDRVFSSNCSSSKVANEMSNELSPTYVPLGRQGWWGGPDLRERCTKDDFVVLTEEKAKERAEKVRLKPGMERFSAYKGKTCGYWHVGIKRSRK